MGSNDPIQRSVLPIPDRKPVSLTTYDAKDPDTKFPPIAQLRPPKGAPNILVILIDDVGFGASSGYAGQDLKALGIPSEQDYIARYAKRTGRDGIPHWDFYLAEDRKRGHMIRMDEGNMAVRTFER